MTDDDRPRKSWKEIDRQRDKSSHRREERPSGRGPKGPGREKSYKAALDRLFDSGKIADLVEQRDPGSKQASGESRIKMLAKIRNAGDRNDLTQSVDAYLDKYSELPDDDMEILSRVLEHRNPTRQLEAMEQIEKLLDQERPKRTRAMLGQLRMIRDIEDDEELKTLAGRLIERLE